MKAPEIIFLPIVNIGVEDGECLAPIWWNKDKTAKHLEAVKAVEYIRKDTLLEWLNNEVERYNDKLIQPSNNKEEAIQIASSISSLLVVVAKLETL